MRQKNAQNKTRHQIVNMVKDNIKRGWVTDPNADF